MDIGVTGHQALDDEAGWLVARTEVEVWLAKLPRPVTAYSSLAAGADQLFAEQVLAVGGALVAVLPFPGYRSTLSGVDRASFDRLESSAISKVTLPYALSDENSYLAAGKFIVDHVYQLLAIWDGRPAQGLGGTADIVAYARERNREVHIVDVSPWRRGE